MSKNVLKSKENLVIVTKIAKLLNATAYADSELYLDATAVYIGQHVLRLDNGALRATHCGNVQFVPGKTGELTGHVKCILNSKEAVGWKIREDLSELYCRVTGKVRLFSESTLTREGDRLHITWHTSQSTLRFNLVTGSLSLMRKGDDAYYIVEGGTLSDRAVARDAIRGHLASLGRELP